MERLMNAVLAFDAEDLEAFDDQKKYDELKAAHVRSAAYRYLAGEACRKGDYTLECELYYKSMLPHTKRDKDLFAKAGKDDDNIFYQFAAKSFEVGGGVSGNEKDKLRHPDLVDLCPCNYEVYAYEQLAKAHEKAGNTEEASACRTVLQRRFDNRKDSLQ
jgi:hypothetical protein